MKSRNQYLLILLVVGSSQAMAVGDLGRVIATQGDEERQIPPCSSCHGTDGGGDEATASARLAGQNAIYLARQIENFRAGRRNHPLMQPWAMRLTEKEIGAVTDYYASLPPASNAQPPQGVDLADGVALALYGDWRGRRLPGCVQCHGPSGSGVGDTFPALNGQPYSYLLSQLTAWTQDARSGDPLGMMAAVGGRLTAQESKSAAAYFAGLPPEGLGSDGEAQTPAESASTPAGLAARAEGDRSGPSQEDIPGQVDIPAGRAPDAQGYFEPPMRSERPDGRFGEMVALGEAIFRDTDTHPDSAPYVGNAQSCENCHLDAGRLPNSAPLWAAWVAYPAYRSKSHRVDTLASRIQGCFRYSMNARASVSGQPPAADSTVVVALLSYSYWLATNAPTGDTGMPGRGYPDLAATAEGYDAQRGQIVYQDKCAICHASAGAGQRAEGQVVFPPLWGADAFNWGAGMHSVATAAAFIKFNMPLGGFLELTDQEAWDVAAFVNSHERPQDPRFTGDIAETAKRFHSGRDDLYGTPSPFDGHLLGRGAAND